MISKLRRLAAPIAFVTSLLMLGAFALAPMPAQAQSINTALINLSNADPVAGTVGADDTDVALLVKYVGNVAAPTSNSGLVAVVSANAITFTQGVLGAEVASTEFECPVSGALGGIIDVSNAACDTIGEVVDVINASTSWRAVPLDALRTDSTATKLLALSATRATSEAGLNLYWDTSSTFNMSIAMTPYRSMKDYLVPGTRATLRLDRYEGTRTGVFTANGTSTYGSGTSTWQFFSIAPKNPGAAGKSSEVVTQLYAAPAGATTVNNVITFGDFGVQSKRNEKLLVRLNNSAAMASAVLRAYGLIQRYQ